MPNWSDDEGRCHYSVNGVPCYQSPVDKCPAHGGMARVKRDECEHGSLRRKCQRCADRTELDELRAEVERLRDELDRMRPHTEGCNWQRRGDAYPCSCMTEVERLRTTLQQVLVNINDPRPRTATLGGYRDALMATEGMIHRVLNGTEG